MKKFNSSSIKKINENNNTITFSYFGHKATFNKSRFSYHDLECFKKYIDKLFIDDILNKF